MQKDKKTIAKLTISNSELENYFRNTIIPQLFVDAALVLRKFTPPAMRQFNLQETDIGKPIESIQDNFRFSGLLDNIQSVIENHEILEKEIQTTDFRWYQMNILPYVVYPGNDTNGVIITFVDITNRVKDLKEQERLIADHETLLDTLAHDVKNPLQNLVMAVDAFKRVKPEDKAQYSELVDVIDRALYKMRTLISDLTTKRESEHGYKAQAELLDIQNIWEDVRLLLADNINRSGAIIKTDFSVSEVSFVRRNLRSILFNLVANAIKYTKEGVPPEIAIETATIDGWFVLTIKDKGIGISKEKAELVFDKYYRVNNAIEGSGIGLYLVREIVRNSGGKVELQSEPGAGTKVRVLLKAEHTFHAANAAEAEIAGDVAGR